MYSDFFFSSEEIIVPILLARNKMVASSAHKAGREIAFNLPLFCSSREVNDQCLVFFSENRGKQAAEH